MCSVCVCMFIFGVSTCVQFGCACIQGKQVCACVRGQVNWVSEVVGMFTCMYERQHVCLDVCMFTYGRKYIYNAYLHVCGHLYAYLHKEGKWVCGGVHAHLSWAWRPKVDAGNLGILFCCCFCFLEAWSLNKI